jgi:glutamate-1-semialdehyde aminotransferase/spore coat polysaccharide biosynthesis protein SpsF (cytidylyltransferase family)
MKVIAITQARVGSSRLPAKVLKEVNGKTLLQTHIERASKSKLVDKLFVATTIEPDAVKICAICDQLNVPYYRGSVNDVLDRFYMTAKPEQPDYVVRITSDCPLIDATIIDKAIEACIKGNYDYCSTGLKPTYPDGFDVEVMKFSALEKAWQQSGLTSEREHVTSYIWKNVDFNGGSLFTSVNITDERDCSHYRLTVDEPSDFELVSKVIEAIGDEKGWLDYVNYIDEHPALFEINSFIKRNEGYMKSIQEDKQAGGRTITNFQNSNVYRSKIHDLIPGGAHTYSKGDDQFPQLSPAAIAYGKGAYVWDLDGNKYLDCSMGLGSVSLGHAYEPVINRVKEELDRGVNFQRPSALEMEVAEKFLSLIPQHQMIKFGKNGSLVITAALKLARAATGKKLVAFPYDHPFYSYDDWFIGKTPCDAGVLEETKDLSVTFKSYDLNSLEEIFNKYPGQIACVVSEPEKGDTTIDVKEYLTKAIELCHKNGALFIQDEMVTGFKSEFPGSISKYNIEPDMATWGKGIANGFSFCALTGKKEVMELGGIRNTGAEKVFLISTTHGGETTAMAAVLATMKEFQEKDVIKHNHSNGKHLIDSIRPIIEAHGLADYVEVVPCNWSVTFGFRNKEKEISSGMRTLMLQEMIGRGVLFQGAFISCYSHTKADVDFFVQCFSQSLNVYKKAFDEGYENYLVGEPAKPVFRKII